MKKLNVSIVITGVLFTSLLITNCGSKQNEAQQEQTEERVEMDSTKMDSTNHNTMTATVYACSMHPEVTGNEGDKCAKCGMALEAVKVTNEK